MICYITNRDKHLLIIIDIQNIYAIWRKKLNSLEKRKNLTSINTLENKSSNQPYVGFILRILRFDR